MNPSRCKPDRGEYVVRQFDKVVRPRGQNGCHTVTSLVTGLTSRQDGAEWRILIGGHSGYRGGVCMQSSDEPCCSAEKRANEPLQDMHAIPIWRAGILLSPV